VADYRVMMVKIALPLDDRHSLYYRRTFFHPPVNWTMFPAFYKLVCQPIYQLLVPIL